MAAQQDGELVRGDFGCRLWEAQSRPPLLWDPDHALACGRRWYPGRVDRVPAGDQPDSWLAQQCGACCYHLVLDGALLPDWGICSNVTSHADGLLRFEHDGCDQCVPSTQGWGGPTPRASLRRSRETEDDETDPGTGKKS